jgi:hypothetical protein
MVPTIVAARETGGSGAAVIRGGERAVIRG